MAWYIENYFAGFLVRRDEVVRETKTQLVTRVGDRFRKPETRTDGDYIHRVGGNDHHLYKLRKIDRKI